VDKKPAKLLLLVSERKCGFGSQESTLKRAFANMKTYL